MYMHSSSSLKFQEHPYAFKISSSYLRTPNIMHIIIQKAGLMVASSYHALRLYQGHIEPPMAVRGHAMCVDIEILIVTNKLRVLFQQLLSVFCCFFIATRSLGCSSFRRWQRLSSSALTICTLSKPPTLLSNKQQEVAETAFAEAGDEFATAFRLTNIRSQHFHSCNYCGFGQLEGITSSKHSF